MIEILRFIHRSWINNENKAHLSRARMRFIIWHFSNQHSLLLASYSSCWIRIWFDSRFTLLSTYGLCGKVFSCKLNKSKIFFSFFVTNLCVICVQAAGSDPVALAELSTNQQQWSCLWAVLHRPPQQPPPTWPASILTSTTPHQYLHISHNSHSNMEDIVN